MVNSEATSAKTTADKNANPTICMALAFVLSSSATKYCLSTPKYVAIAFMISLSGYPLPFSHFAIRLRLTWSCSASCSCVIFFLARRDLSLSLKGILISSSVICMKSSFVRRRSLHFFACDKEIIAPQFSNFQQIGRYDCCYGVTLCDYITL